MSQENYELGKSVREFVKNFQVENEKIEKTFSLVPNQMEETLSFIEDVSQSFHCYYNLGDKVMVGNKLSVSKQAVEKFIFNKIYHIIYELYNKKYQKENELFMKKQNKIRNELGYEKIMDYLEVRLLNLHYTAL